MYLIFVAKQRLEKGKNLHVSLKNDWPYELDKSPFKNIGFTLKKYKLVKDQTEETEKA